MIAEIINPSDSAYIEHDDPAVLAAAVYLLGEGRYGAKAVGFDMPLFLFSNPDPWFAENYDVSLGDILRDRKSELADALSGVRLCKSAEAYHDARCLTGNELESDHDKHRSSLNDLARRAWHIAAFLRKEGGDA